MITVEVGALVRRLHLNEGVSQREIAKRLGIARNTIAKEIKSEKPPKYEGVGRSSGMRNLEPRIRELLSQNGECLANGVSGVFH